MEVLNNDPEKKEPEGTPINDLAKTVEWPIPTWVADSLFIVEFKDKDQAIIDMLNQLGEAIEKAMQSGAVDSESLSFDYYRKAHPHDRKLHRIELTGTLYENPTYGNIWLLIDYEAN